MAYKIKTVWEVKGKSPHRGVKSFVREFDHYPSEQEIIDELIHHRTYTDCGYMSMGEVKIQIREVMKVHEEGMDDQPYNYIIPPVVEPKTGDPLYEIPGTF